MKVLHVITGLAAGGAETQLRLLLGRTRHSADVVSLYNVGSVGEQLRADGVSVTDLGMTSNRQFGAVLRLVRIIRHGGYDVVHTHLFRACLYGRIAARLAGVPVIVATEHSLLDDQLEGRPATRGVRLLYRFGERLGSTTIAVSDAVRANLLRWGLAPEKVVTVPNGLDLEALAFVPQQRVAVRESAGIPADAVVVGAVGRLHPGKRFDVLVRALAPGLGDGRHLLILGEGPHRAALTQLADELGVARWVHLLGEQPAAPALAAMDVLVSPSRQETFGLAVLEGLAAGLPVLFARCPALDELGVVVPHAARLPPDDADLADAVTTALTQFSGARSCPDELRVLDLAAIAGRIDALYERLA